MKKISQPIFSRPLHVGRPNIGNREQLLERLNQMLDHAWLTNRGPMVQEFEERIAGYLGVKHCIATCNGTVALELAIRAVGMTGEVIIPSLTFIATAHALQWQEITPVFCDIDPRNCCINPDEVERYITPQTTGIIGVHLYGRSCDIDSLKSIADKYNLRLLFDAAHVFGCSYKGQLIGCFGDCEVFSFHATKVLNAFEGGAITTNDDTLAEKIRLMKNFGFAGMDQVIYIGTNGQMNEACAAMGLTNLENFENFLSVNHRNWNAYVNGLETVAGIKLLSYNESERNNYHYVIAEIDSEIFGMTRDELMAELYKHNILVRRYFHPGCHRMEPYRTLYPNAGLDLSETEAFCERVMAFPTGTQITPEEIHLICKFVHTIQQEKSTGF